MTTTEDGEKTQHNSTQTPSDMSPPPLNDDFLPQAHHQYPGHCISSFNLINRMRQNIQLCDVKLEAGGETIHAHKVILASASPYFYAMFNGNYRPSDDQSPIGISSSSHFHFILLFIFTSMSMCRWHARAKQGCGRAPWYWLSVSQPINFLCIHRWDRHHRGKCSGVASRLEPPANSISAWGVL